MHSTLLAALVAAIVSGLGWIISQLLTFDRENVGRQVNARRKFLEQQIEEFYGPLVSLTCQIDDARAVRTRMIRASIAALKKGIQWDTENRMWIANDADRNHWPVRDTEEVQHVADTDREQFYQRQPIITIRFYTLEKFIYPLYDKANTILAEKMHLLGETDIPDSYRRFMRHSLQSRLQSSLYKDTNISSDFTRAPDYPEEFSLDVSRRLSILMTEYRQLQGQIADAAQWRVVLGRRLRAALGLNSDPRPTQGGRPEGAEIVNFRTAWMIASHPEPSPGTGTKHQILFTSAEEQQTQRGHHRSEYDAERGPR